MCRSQQSILDDWNFDNDYRVRAARRGKDGHFDAKKMTISVELYDPAKEENVIVEIPAKYEVCSICDGKGTHVKPSLDAGGLSREDFEDDPEFAEAYMNGAFDVPCYGCEGQRVQPVIHVEKADADVIRQIRERAEEEEQDRRMQEAERRYGA